jgi:DNA-directed RNA polymerase subunit RPC12/RpoP
MSATPERAFRCPTCRRRFRSFGSLENHMREHAADPKCSKCGAKLRPHESHYYGCP